jgi:hypothetical protein
METHYLNLPETERAKRRRQGKGNYLYVRYADDCVVLCNGIKSEALSMKEEVRTVLSKMGLTLSEDKTKITHITEGFTFLGYKVMRNIGTSGKMVPKVLIPDKAIKRFRWKIRAMLAPSAEKHSLNANIVALNRFIQGWCEYYRSTSSPATIFSRLAYEVFWDMAHWLGRKYKVSIPTVMRRFSEGNTFRTTTRTLKMPTEYKAKKLFTTTWHNPYTNPEAARKEKDRIRREVLFSYNIGTGYHHRHNGMDLREEVLLRDGPICAKCQKTFHPSEVHVDHINARLKFADPSKADTLDNLQILCIEEHRAKTKSDLKVLSRVRRKPQARLCVQRRLACSVGGKPTRGKVRAL